MQLLELSRSACLMCALVLLGGCSEDPDPSRASDPATSDTVQDESGAATPTSPSASPSSSQKYADLSEFGEGRVPPGRYAFLAYSAGEKAPVPIMKVPQGYAAYRGFGVGAVDGPGFRSVMAWTVDSVNRQPCSSASAVRIGPRAKDFVDALSRQRTTATTPAEPVQVDGLDGYYLELTGPTKAAFDRCEDSFDLWTNAAGTSRYLQAPGQVERLWVLDTPGGRLVLDATTTPAVKKVDARELVDIVRSARFVSP